MEPAGLAPKASLLNSLDSTALDIYRVGWGAGHTHGCKGIPQVFLVNNAITVLVNYCEGLWRSGAGRS